MRYAIYIAWLLAAITTQAQVGFRSIPLVNTATKPIISTTPFSPSDVAGMQLWFKGESFTGMSEWASISNWPSSAPLFPTRYATNAASDQWPRLTNTFGTKVGTNSLWFDGNAGNPDYLPIVNALSMTKNIASCSVISVTHAIDTGNEKVIYWVSKGDSAAGSRHYLPVNATEQYFGFGRTLDSDSSAGVSNNPSLTLPVIFEADFLHSTGDLMVYTNGILASQNLTWHADSNTSNTDSLTMAVGGGNGGTSPWSGWIAEVIVYVPAISSADRASVTSYLKTKYGL